MAKTSRQKACIPCAAAKRRCDRQLPECDRCLDRDVDCVYPQPKRRRRERRVPSERDGSVEEVIHTSAFEDVNTTTEPGIPGVDFGFGNWGMGATEIDMSMNDMIMPYIPAFPGIPPSSNAALPSDTMDLQGRAADDALACPWFLDDESWTLHYNTQEAQCATVPQLEPFIGAIGEMLEQWVKKGHNTFIHRRLYEYGMPTCLQDAYTTLSSYQNCTPEMNETILQIADDRASTLSRQTVPATNSSRTIRAHLARVHSMFIYMYIRLFDGSVRFRASAERQVPVLRQWVRQMWEIVKNYRGEDSALASQPSQQNGTDFDRQYSISSDMWRLWILTESLRRSLLIIDTTANIYQIMTQGWAECTGGLSFTARRGLWDADSAAEWIDQRTDHDLLLVPALQPEKYIANHEAEKFDDFAKFLWKFIAGPDKIQMWIDRGKRATAI